MDSLLKNKTEIFVFGLVWFFFRDVWNGGGARRIRRLGKIESCCEYFYDVQILVNGKSAVFLARTKSSAKIDGQIYSLLTNTGGGSELSS